MMSAFYPQLQAYVSVPPVTISPNVVANSTTRLVVTGDLDRRVAGLSLTSLVGLIDDIGATPHTEVELYRAWLLANETSDMGFAAWFNLAAAFVLVGDHGSAIIAYRNVLVLKPEFDPASAALDFMLSRSGELCWEQHA
jgi:hypothetical protein